MHGVGDGGQHVAWQGVAQGVPARARLRIGLARVDCRCPRSTLAQRRPGSSCVALQGALNRHAAGASATQGAGLIAAVRREIKSSALGCAAFWLLSLRRPSTVATRRWFDRAPPRSWKLFSVAGIGCRSNGELGGYDRNKNGRETTLSRVQCTWTRDHFRRPLRRSVRTSRQTGLRTGAQSCWSEHFVACTGIYKQRPIRACPYGLGFTTRRKFAVYHPSKISTSTRVRASVSKDLFARALTVSDLRHVGRSLFITPPKSQVRKHTSAANSHSLWSTPTRTRGLSRYLPPRPWSSPTSPLACWGSHS